MSIAIGAILAFIVGSSATYFRLDRDRALYPVVVIVIASYYVLFAVMGAAPTVIVIEIVVAIAYLGWLLGSGKVPVRAG